MKKYCALLISHGNPCIFHPLPNIPQVSARSQTYLLRLYSQIRERKRDIAHCPLFDVTKCTGSETGCLSKRSPPKKIESSPSQISWLVSWVTQVIRSLKTRFLMMERIGKTLKMMESKIYSSISRPSSTTITKVEWLLELLFTDKKGFLKNYDRAWKCWNIKKILKHMNEKTEWAMGMCRFLFALAATIPGSI